jgi:DNA-binding HxlR family transcriptional regulator
MSPGGEAGSSPSISGLDLDKVIHERSRLMILTFLASSESGEVGFTELRDSLGFSAGNLSVQLRTLDEAGYLRIDKRFVSNKSYTGVRLTEAGESALSAYLAELEIIVASLKSGVLAPAGAAAAGEGPAGGRGGSDGCAAPGESDQDLP